MPSEGLRLGHDSGSILCDTLKKVAFSDGLVYPYSTKFCSFIINTIHTLTNNQKYLPKSTSLHFFSHFSKVNDFLMVSCPRSDILFLISLLSIKYFIAE